MADLAFGNDQRGRRVRQVGHELEAGADALATWAEAQGDGFFVPTDAAVLAAAPRVGTWVLPQGFEPVAVNTFLQVADFWLVSAALAGHPWW